MTRPRVVLIGDKDRLKVLSDYLFDLGHDTVVAPSPEACSRALGQGAAALIAIDLDDPATGGLGSLRALRDTRDAALVAMSGAADPVEAVVCLEIGADDFIAMPGDPQEIAARIGNILARRGAMPDRTIIRLEHVSIDLAGSCLLRAGALPERLGPGEVALIRTLAQRPNTLLSRDELMDLAPAESSDAHDRSIDGRIARLRRKLETESIQTVRGLGYRFVPPFDRGG